MMIPSQAEVDRLELILDTKSEALQGRKLEVGEFLRPLDKFALLYKMRVKMHALPEEGGESIEPQILGLDVMDFGPVLQTLEDPGTKILRGHPSCAGTHGNLRRIGSAFCVHYHVSKEDRYYSIALPGVMFAD